MLGKKIIYNPKAIVYHRVLPHRLKLSYLAKRAFNQGFSKAVLSSMYGSEILTVEKNFLMKALKSSIKGLLSIKGFIRSALIASLSALVITGYIYGYLKGAIKLW